jgi:2-polyprenyl-6-methoxyphenol hydroxylase-like FAD-dependent oxidoreductase
VVFCTSLTGQLIQRLDAAFATADVPWSVLPEPAQWTAQFSVERVLRSELATRESVLPLWGRTVVDVAEGTDGVTATVCDDSGGRSWVRGRYLVAADGGRSGIREQLGIPLTGSSHGINNLQVIFDAPGLAARHRHGPALQYWVVHDEVSGLLGQLDTGDRWWAIVIDAPPEPSVESTTRALHALIGEPVPLQVVAQNAWTARMLIADRYRHGRCFLAGDAAHLNPPWGGFGANTGIGDAVDLGWKLAATLDGWGGGELLDSYNSERRVFAEAAIRAATDNMAVLTPELRRPHLNAPGAAGEQARRLAAETITQTKSGEMYTLGFVLGTGCPDSPLVIPDSRHASATGGTAYQPSARPGMRLPHLWLARGVSLYDALGAGFTLIECGAPGSLERWTVEAGFRGVPLTIVRINRPDAVELFDAGYVLVRPDQLVAWRGDDVPLDVGTLLDQVRGAGDHLLRQN